MSLTKISLILSTLIVCFVGPGAALADEYHYNNILMGERALGLGGAYTAVADDPSGNYYNPAGIAYSNGRTLSGSVNTFYRANTVYEDALGTNDYSRESTGLLPNFFGMVQPFWKGTVGFSYAVTDSILEDQDQTFIAPNNNVDTFRINVNNQDST